MGVACQILINKTKEGVHRPGQPVAGVVKYAVDEPTEYKDIVLSLLGTGYCSWTETSTTGSGSGSTTSSTTYTGREEYVQRHINLLNKRPGQTVILNVGSYEYPFEFILPNDIPPSFKNSTCTIRYRIELKFEKAKFFSINKKFTAELPVYGYVYPTLTDGPIIFGVEKTLLKPFSARKHKINLKVEIAKASLTPGENANLSFVVTNDTDVPITSVKTQICSHTKYTADCGRTNHNVKNIKGSVTETASVPANRVGRMSSVVPILPELYSIQHSKVMVTDYKLKVTVRLPVPHTDAAVEIPLVIGERHGDLSTDVEVLADDVELPPSYWEAMCEDKH